MTIAFSSEGERRWTSSNLELQLGGAKAGEAGIVPRKD
jgi:hypothetical protein